MDQILLSILVSSLITGSIYALVAIGLSLVWGTLGVFNFAQGALLMMGAYAVYYLGGNVWGRVGLLFAIPLSFFLIGVLGTLFYRVVVKPFVGSPTGEMSIIMATLALGVFFENGALQFFGAQFRQLPLVFTGDFTINFISITWQQVLIIMIAPLMLFGLNLFLKKSKIGIAVRAVAQNRDSALLLGVPVEKIYLLVFFLSASFSSVAGVLFGGQYFVSPDMGGNLMLQAFIVVVLGGLGNMNGTIVAAYLVGLISSLANFYIGLFWTPAVLFAVLFILVLLRPNGLLAKEKS